ncbi:MAG: hypothetical protein IJ008_02725 [Clostridia bacterium]|nr:hypothetical protein [Clostridia bacterium]
MEEIKNEEQPQILEGSSSEQIEEIDEQKSEAKKSVSFGKFKDVEALLNAYENLEKEFTKKCQLLSEFEKDKVCKEEEKSKNLEEKLSKFLKENSDAINYIDEIKSIVDNSDELKNESDPFGHAFENLVFNSLKGKNKTNNKIVENFVLKDEEIKNIILENYMTELKENFAPKVISSGSGERVPLQKNNETPSSLKEAKLLVQEMFS